MAAAAWSSPDLIAVRNLVSAARGPTVASSDRGSDLADVPPSVSSALADVLASGVLGASPPPQPDKETLIARPAANPCQDLIVALLCGCRSAVRADRMVRD